MAQMGCTLRPGRSDDAPLLAELINYAGEGLPLYFWSKTAGPDETAWDVGHRRAAREEAYGNATIIEHNGNAAGCLIGYGIGSSPAPIPSDMPAIFAPLHELQNLAPDTWYVNVLAIRPQFRRTGLGTRLLAHADEIASGRGHRALSIVVSDANRGARRLYERCGYREVATRAMVKEVWVNEGQNWVLLMKMLGTLPGR
jgi:ribosomal protein S18 acetylase RimI-like enzyme